MKTWQVIRLQIPLMEANLRFSLWQRLRRNCPFWHLAGPSKTSPVVELCSACLAPFQGPPTCWVLLSQKSLDQEHDLSLHSVRHKQDCGQMQSCSWQSWAPLPTANTRSLTEGQRCMSFFLSPSSYLFFFLCLPILLPAALWQGPEPELNLPVKGFQETHTAHSPPNPHSETLKTISAVPPLFFFFCYSYSIPKFLGQGSNSYYSSDNADSLTEGPPGNSPPFPLGLPEGILPRANQWASILSLVT